LFVTVYIETTTVFPKNFPSQFCETSTAAVMTSEKHHCPFEGCSGTYKKKKGLKDHLIGIRGTESYDRVHGKEDPLWAQLTEEGFFKVTFSKAILLTFGPGQSQGKPH
jgi:hypothetical protein